MTLVSPGVQVNVIDESFYTPASAGTVPMIFVATAENKPNNSGTGIAEGTLASNAGRAYLLTSQRELGETFGDPLFYSDGNGNMIHGSELNEYGLQTAYSLLGVSNRAYVVRADLDLGKLEPSAEEPGGEPTNGTYWFDTQITQFGLLEWNASPVTISGGQTFTALDVISITDQDEVEDFSNDNYTPRASIGSIGDYAVVSVTTTNRAWYKNQSAVWVEVGSEDWISSWPVVTGTSNPSFTDSEELVINGITITITTGVSDTGPTLASTINSEGIDGVSAAFNDNALEIFSTGVDVEISGSAIENLGLTAAIYAAPALEITPHTQVPEWKSFDAIPRPTGSIWFKTTTPNGGANIRVRSWNTDTQLWENIAAPVYDTAENAIFNLDRAGGGSNLQVGDLYVLADINNEGLANFKLYRRVTSGPTKIVSSKITADTFIPSSDVDFIMEETLINDSTVTNTKTVTFTASGSSNDASSLASAIGAAGFTNIQASVDAQNRLIISHKLGGDIRIIDTNGSLTEAGFVVFDETDSTTTANLYYSPGTDGTEVPLDLRASNWKVLSYTASEDAPSALTTDGELWYNSIVDEVDILIHDGFDWVGYQNYDHGNGTSSTDINGPIVAAAEPTENSVGSNLVTGDLWIDTADVDNYPQLYKYVANVGWISIDKSDQTTENGVLFDDVRWGNSGTDSEKAGISDLLVSNYKDPDAPDPALYPKGMLLWNLRRSGFNVKRFVRNYINTAEDNERFDVNVDSEYDRNGNPQSQADYYPHRWVTASGNNEDGSGTFGRNAQRKTVVQALQALVNSNQDIRDEEIRQFNLIACPGYPELIGEMVTLNYDRRLTAFVVGDTPARLTPNATALNEWASSARLAVEDNDNGAVSFDEYLGMYYPWGFTSDNAGNNVVVPPSHMALRTLVLNDQVAYPWFAPAGTRRGGVTNATSSGYINSEGEFVSVALNTGQRDTLYLNNINPITFLNGSGLVVFGQKTRARNASALDRINVARLVVYMRVQLEKLARPYLFEPNDKITRDQIKSAADAFCLELVGLRALYDFLVVCDESNNTPARIDRNELYLDIAIEPVKAIEFIYIPLRIKNTGEIAALGA